MSSRSGDREAVLGRELLHQAAHFSVPDNRQVHRCRVHDSAAAPAPFSSRGQKLPHHPLVDLRGLGKVTLRDALFVGVRDVNIPRPDQEGLAPAIRKRWHIRRVSHDGRRESVQRLETYRRDAQNFPRFGLARDGCVHRPPHRLGIAD